MLSRQDSLSGVANLRQFMELAEQERSRATRYRRPLSIVYVDLDNFKAINDTAGHMAGDAVLRNVAHAMRVNVREADVVGRLGGDEFAVLLPETGSDAARAVTNKLQEALGTICNSSSNPVTASFGVATFVEAPASVDSLLGSADRVMYDAKAAGKDTVRAVSVR